jgi:hypothetical protein
MNDPSDDGLLVELAAVMSQADPLPPAVLAAASASLAWRTLEDDIARLVEDSLASTAPVRGDAGRLLSFEAGGLTVEVEVVRAGDRLRIQGQLVPVQAARVLVDHRGSQIGATADAHGRFAVDGVTPGLARFSITPKTPGAGTVHTEWTVL